MLEWPSDNKPIESIEEVLKPIRRSLKRAYNLTRSKRKSIPYDGYTHGQQILAICPDPETALTKEDLKRSYANGKDVLDVILLIAFQLGIEQGKRLEAQQPINLYAKSLVDLEFKKSKHDE